MFSRFLSLAVCIAVGFGCSKKGSGDSGGDSSAARSSPRIQARRVPTLTGRSSSRIDCHRTLPSSAEIPAHAAKCAGLDGP